MALFAIFCVFNGVKRRFIHDEVFHIPVVVDFGKMLDGEKAWSLNYGDSLGPAFYLFYSFFWLANKSLFVMRIPSLLFTVANVTLIYRYLRTSGGSYVACLFVYLSGPWCILSALTVHGEQMAFFTTLVAMLCLCIEADSQRTIGKSILGCAALALTPLVRIYSVFIFPAVAGLSLADRQYRKAIPYLLAALFPLCIVIWIWKGITPPAFRATWGAGGERVMLHAAYLKRPLMMASAMGVYLWPWLFSIPKSVWPKNKLAAVLFISCVVVGFVVPLGVAGPLDSLMRKVLQPGPLPVPYYSLSDKMMAIRLIYGLGLFVLSSVGISCFRRARAFGDRISAVCALALVCYALSLWFSGGLFVERYFFPAYLLCFIMMYRNFQLKAGSLYSFCPMFTIGLVHAFAK